MGPGSGESRVVCIDKDGRKGRRSWARVYLYLTGMNWDGNGLCVRLGVETGGHR